MTKAKTIKTLRDYSVTMKDSTGRTFDVYVNADTVREMVATGYSLEQACQEVADNAFGNAVARGDIGDDAWSL